MYEDGLRQGCRMIADGKSAQWSDIRSVGGFNLIPVAVARDIRQVMPVSGSYTGMSDAFLGMSVEVSVVEAPADHQ